MPRGCAESLRLSGRFQIDERLRRPLALPRYQCDIEAEPPGGTAAKKRETNFREVRDFPHIKAAQPQRAEPVIKSILNDSIILSAVSRASINQSEMLQSNFTTKILRTAADCAPVFRSRVILECARRAREPRALPGIYQDAPLTTDRRSLRDRFSISLVNLTGFHHEVDSLKQLDIGCRIAFDRDDVGIAA